jgi:hypothetical protein
MAHGAERSEAHCRAGAAHGLILPEEFLEHCRFASVVMDQAQGRLSWPQAATLKMAHRQQPLIFRARKT